LVRKELMKAGHAPFPSLPVKLEPRLLSNGLGSGLGGSVCVVVVEDADEEAELLASCVTVDTAISKELVAELGPDSALLLLKSSAACSSCPDIIVHCPPSPITRLLVSSSSVSCGTGGAVIVAAAVETRHTSANKTAHIRGLWRLRDRDSADLEVPRPAGFELGTLIVASANRSGGLPLGTSTWRRRSCPVRGREEHG
jgi:hypothetical protein